MTSPVNVSVLNPEVLQATLEERGANLRQLRRGLHRRFAARFDGEEPAGGEAFQVEETSRSPRQSRPPESIHPTNPIRTGHRRGPARAGAAAVGMDDGVRPHGDLPHNRWSSIWSGTGDIRVDDLRGTPARRTGPRMEDDVARDDGGHRRHLRDPARSENRWRRPLPGRHPAAPSRRRLWLADGDDRLASVTLFTTMTDFTEVGEMEVFMDPGEVAFIEEQNAGEGLPRSEAGRQRVSALADRRGDDLVEDGAPILPRPPRDDVRPDGAGTPTARGCPIDSTRAAAASATATTSCSAASTRSAAARCTSATSMSGSSPPPPSRRPRGSAVI